jgi:hypothetical protein
VVTVRPLVAERRTPVVIVHVVIGPLVLVLGVVGLRHKLQVQPPVADGGAPAIAAKPEVWEPIERAVLGAVQADPAARAHLFGPKPDSPALTGQNNEKAAHLSERPFQRCSTLSATFSS